MRITDQMTNRMAERTGLPVFTQKRTASTGNTLLSALDKKEQSTSQYEDLLRSSLPHSADGQDPLADDKYDSISTRYDAAGNLFLGSGSSYDLRG